MSSLDQRRNDRDEGSDEDDMTTTYVAVGKNIIYGVLVGVAAAFVGCQVIFWTTDFKGKKGVLENSFPSDPTSLPYALGADDQTGGYRSSCAYGTSNLSLSSGRDDQRIAFPYYLTNGLVKVDYDGRIEDKTVFEARGAGVQGGIHGLISAIGYTPSTVVPHVRGLWKWMLSHDAPPSRLLDLVRMYFGGLALIPYSLLVASLGIMLCLTALLPIWLSFGPKYSPWRTHAAPFPWGLNWSCLFLGWFPHPLGIACFNNVCSRLCNKLSSMFDRRPDDIRHRSYDTSRNGVDIIKG